MLFSFKFKAFFWGGGDGRVSNLNIKGSNSNLGIIPRKKSFIQFFWEGLKSIISGGHHFTPYFGRKHVDLIVCGCDITPINWHAGHIFTNNKQHSFLSISTIFKYEKKSIIVYVNLFKGIIRIRENGMWFWQTIL